MRGGTLSRRTALPALSSCATRLTPTGRLHRPAPPGLWRPRRTLAVPLPIQRPLNLGAQGNTTTTLPIKSRLVSSCALRHCQAANARHGYPTQRAPSSSSRRRQPNLLIPSLGPFGAPILTCCSGRAATHRNNRLQRRPPPASAVPARRHCVRCK
jgi:hypothetical protein